MPITDNRELSELREALTDRAEELVAYVLGAERNNKLSTRRTAIWGSKGAFKLECSGTTRGLWYDHEAGEGGDLFTLVQKRLTGGTFADAVASARNWLGWPAGGPSPDVTADDKAGKARAKRAALEDVRRAEANAVAAEERLRKRHGAQSRWARAIPINPGDPADLYLRRTRCIVPSRPWPDSLRYMQGGDQGLLAAVTDPEGVLTGCQLIRLTDEGMKRKGGQQVLNKQSFGAIAGSAVRLTGAADGPLLLTEGVETALSAWSATGFETLAVLAGIGSAAKLALPIGRKIVICTDDDKRGSGAWKAARKAVRELKMAGYDVIAATPWKHAKEDKSDLNDVLKAQGPDAVRARIKRVADHKTTIASKEVSLEAGRALLDNRIGEFFATIMPGQNRGKPPVHAIAVSLGVGKTRTALLHAATKLKRLRAAGDHRAIVYAVPEHRLSQEVATRFSNMHESGELTVAIWRGREAKFPLPHLGPELMAKCGTDPNEDRRMCKNLEPIREALALYLPSKRVCRSCTFYDGNYSPRCAYVSQSDNEADLWIVSHNLLFIKPPYPVTRAGVAALIIDESPWQAGLIGCEAKPLAIPFDSLDPGQMPIPIGGELLEAMRHSLKTALVAEPDGPVRASLLEGVGFDAQTGEVGEAMEWSRRIDTGSRKYLALNRTIGVMVGLWRAVAHLLKPDGRTGDRHSGWLSLGRGNNGERLLIVRGRRDVHSTWNVPTLLVDAFLDERLLKPFWPTLELKARIDVATPHMRLHQVAGRSFAKSMLAPLPEAADETDKRARARNRLKLATFLATVARQLGGKSLFISNKVTVEATQLPPGVEAAHFNAIAGRDNWGDVRTLVVAGRTQPPPQAVEAMAAALSGEAVGAIEGWYPRTDVIRLQRAPGGATIIPSEADRHPHAIAEAIRARIAEGEVMQAIGRGRGVNRTAGTPLDVFVLSDAVLTMPVDEFLPNEIVMKPTILDKQMAIAGVAFESAAHAFRAYPKLWGSATAARKAMQHERDENGVSSVTFPYKSYPIEECHSASLGRVTYQLCGDGAHPAKAWVYTATSGDARTAVEKLLGSVAWFDMAEPNVGHDIAPSVPARAPPKRVADLPDEERQEVQRALSIFHAFAELQSGATAEAANDDFQQAKADSATFMRSWTTEAVALGWSPNDLFAPPNAVGRSGLVCWLGGEQVRAFGPEHAVSASGRVFDKMAA